MDRYKLPRPLLGPELSKVVSREIRKQKIEVTRASKKVMKEIAEVSHAIDKIGLPDYLICKKLPGGLGGGIFLHPEAKPIAKGQVIAPYAGDLSMIPQSMEDESVYAFTVIDKILLSKDEQKLLDPKNTFHPRRRYALNLDALINGNFTRFINHSEDPNLDAITFKIPRNDFGLAETPIEIIYVANKKIQPGEQLLVCYEDEDKTYWSALKIEPLHITPKTFTLSDKLEVVGSL